MAIRNGRDGNEKDPIADIVTITEVRLRHKRELQSIHLKHALELDSMNIEPQIMEMVLLTERIDKTIDKKMDKVRKMEMIQEEILRLQDEREHLESLYSEAMKKYME